MTKTKISLRRIIFGAMAMTWHYRGALAKALFLPVVLLMALKALELFELPSSLNLALLIPELCVYTVFAVTTHRIILLGTHSVPDWGLRRWTSRETYFAAHLAALSLLTAVLVMLPTLGAMLLSSMTWPHFGFFSGLVVATYLCSRLSLVFPGSAIDQGITFRESWHLSRRYQILMIGVIALVPVLSSIPTLLVPDFTYDFVIATMLDTLFSVIVICCLSLAYREIGKLEYES